MTKRKSSYQKLKERVQELEHDLFVLCNEEDSPEAYRIKVSYQFKKSFQDAVMFGECRFDLPELDHNSKFEGLGIVGMMEKHYAKLIEEREQYLIKQLKKRGFEFSSKAELQEFLKTRCELLIIQGTQKKIFKVDGKPILQFDDEVQIVDVSDNSIKITTGGIYEIND